MRASSRTGSKAIEKSCLKKKKQIVERKEKGKARSRKKGTRVEGVVGKMVGEDGIRGRRK